MTDTFYFLKGLIGALNTVSQLLTYLRFKVRHKVSFTYLLTRHLITDPIENFFSVIRQRGGYNSNPTLLQFTHAYKVAMFN